MARINIDDSIYSDPRFIRLVILCNGNMDQAVGQLVRAWSLAQKWYLKSPDSFIPLHEWNARSIPMNIVTAGLAEIVNDRVRVMGSDDQFRWLIQKSNAGKSNRDIKGKSRQRPLTGDVKRRPLPLSLSLSLIQNTNTIEHFVFDFESLYRKYPRKKGKSSGIKKLAKEIKTKEDYNLLAAAIESYANDCIKNKTEEKYIKHFSTFVGCWRDWMPEGPREIESESRATQIENRARVSLEEYRAKKQEMLDAYPK